MEVSKLLPWTLVDEGVRCGGPKRLAGWNIVWHVEQSRWYPYLSTVYRTMSRYATYDSPHVDEDDVKEVKIARWTGTLDGMLYAECDYRELHLLVSKGEKISEKSLNKPPTQQLKRNFRALFRLDWR